MATFTLIRWPFYGLTSNSVTHKVDSRVYLVPNTVGYLSDMNWCDGAAIDAPMRAPSTSSVKRISSIADIEKWYRAYAIDMAVYRVRRLEVDLRWFCYAKLSALQAHP